MVVVSLFFLGGVLLEFMRYLEKVEAYHCRSSVVFLRRQNSSQRENYDNVWGDVKTITLASYRPQSNHKEILTVIVNTVIVLQGVIEQPCRKLNQNSQACGVLAHFTLIVIYQHKNEHSTPQ